MFSNETTANKKNEIFTVIEVCNTQEFNFDTVIQGVGFSRTFSECFEIDSHGNFGESVLITEYILKYILDDNVKFIEPENAYFTLKDFAKALEFTLISEGFQHNENLYSDSIILKVRLNTIINSKISKYFSGKEYISIHDYITNLVTKNENKAQIININLEDIDDVHAKVIVKIFSRLMFE